MYFHLFMGRGSFRGYVALFRACVGVFELGVIQVFEVRVQLGIVAGFRVHGWGFRALNPKP